MLDSNHQSAYTLGLADLGTFAEQHVARFELFGIGHENNPRSLECHLFVVTDVVSAGVGQLGILPCTTPPDGKPSSVAKLVMVKLAIIT